MTPLSELTGVFPPGRCVERKVRFSWSTMLTLLISISWQSEFHLSDVSIQEINLKYVYIIKRSDQSQCRQDSIHTLNSSFVSRGNSSVKTGRWVLRGVFRKRAFSTFLFFKDNKFPFLFPVTRVYLRNRKGLKVPSKHEAELKCSIPGCRLCFEERGI